ncbi:MAG: DUF2953 domain-containing protein [Clostridia bacterium]|jgi:hypothetical protein|nr:DUF2953 domain-containing protein [Clostridia bacterium]
MLKTVLFILFFMILICLIPIKIKFRFYRSANNLHLILLLPVWKTPFTIKIDNIVTRIFWGLSQNKFWKKQTPADLQAKDIAWSKVFYRIFYLRQIICTVWQGTMRTLHKITSPIKIKKIDLQTEVALQNAAQTAWAVGVIWWTWGIFYSLLGRYFKITKTTNNIVVIPNYQIQSLFVIDFSCILELTLGHIIIISYYLCINAGKIRRLLRRVS